MVPFEADPSGVTDILGIPLGQLTLNGLAVAVIGLVMMLLLRGILIPKSTHDREIEQANQRVDDFKEIAETANKRADVLEQIGTTVVRILNALPAPEDDPPRGGKS